MTVRRKTAFVTGAASGIGRAIATSLQADGTRIVLADRQAEALQALSNQLGGEVFALPLDITDASAVDACLEQVPAEFRDIDILVNNAGHDIGGRIRFDQGSADDWSAIIETNLIGLMRVTRAILPGMVARGRGDIVNMSSISALRIVPEQAPYSASKAGVHMLSDIIRGELAETPLRVIEIMPGLTRTSIVTTRHRGDEEAARQYFERFGMALDPEDVARCVMFALSQPPHVQIAQMFVLPTNRW
ncbi:MAG: SDR family NAD(P)-dependent oxidoreductase [Mesorhizobium sp.]|uniref:SDR family oxidoreductase n=3 Tax=Mesorhizobium TaxID=68287 RepID=UPI000F75CB51|nr:MULTISPECIES: SDR family oxidoreductase [unclassified Mesorhizobium]RUY03615.1 SDR family NAD(P)-dependent oxidoreductase [Mesorhizobium sp. M2A.F.Ca.ET.040.01.1.1]RVC73813.1 SDR family NAD(P)-dependent oxidoreductase [Mesorhizobium sp. M2A.F.Ca.ET.046.02.1.1]AZO36910.1 SDR family oxidoreductase [Mesorhizobium sp. M2A.F.Ca.ET.046.03.2.1]RWA92229.1 MAG: SDR family NAD(P)-dependent oxidoreductase [Mesorhizobium sp.]RWB48161.1 MAG: SDR family NAD(P)-dependent oxidoreductase [Mesorhizobium sp.]